LFASLVFSCRYDVESSIEWYTANLGFRLDERWGPAFAILELCGESLWLSGPGTSARKPMPDGRVPEPGGWNRFVVVVDEFDQTVSKLKASGVKFRNEPITGPGGSQVLIEDPDGNPVEVFAPG